MKFPTKSTKLLRYAMSAEMHLKKESGMVYVFVLSIIVSAHNKKEEELQNHDIRQKY
jgi:hypothetical protein